MEKFTQFWFWRGHWVIKLEKARFCQLLCQIDYQNVYCNTGKSVLLLSTTPSLPPQFHFTKCRTLHRKCRPPYGKITFEIPWVPRNDQTWPSQLMPSHHTKLPWQLDGSQNGYEARMVQKWRAVLQQRILLLAHRAPPSLSLHVATSKRWFFRLLMLFIASLCSKCAPKWWRNRLKHNSRQLPNRWYF